MTYAKLAPLVINPNNPEAHSMLGLACQMRGTPDAAIVAHKRAIKLNPSYAEAYPFMGHAYWDKGMAEKAVTAWQRASELAPDDSRIQRDLEYARNVRPLEEVYKTPRHFSATIR